VKSIFSFRRIGAILGKDLHDAVRSHTILFSVLVPVLLAVCFNWVMQREDIRLPLLAIHSPEPSRFASAIEALGAFTIRKLDEPGQVRREVESGHAAFGVLIPAGFDDQLAAGVRPNLTLVSGAQDPRRSAVIFTALMELIRSSAGQPPPVRLSIENPSRVISPAQAILPTWVLFALLGGLMIVASSLVEEKETGTLAALLVTPASLGEVLAGKWSLGVLLTILGGSGILLLNRTPGDGGGIYTCLLLGAACFSALGLLVGILAPSQGSSNSVIAVLLVVLFLPPVLAESSRLLGAVAQVLPSFHLMEGMKRALVNGAGPIELAPALGVLAGYTALFGLGALLAMKRINR